MDFTNTGAIYLQIAEYVCDQVQLKKWLPDEKIPSVREMAVMMEVNPNTVMRSYEYLQQQDIIYIKRGMGYYVQKEAPAAIIRSRKKVFLQEELPQLFRKMRMLGIEPEELLKQFEDFKKSI